MSEHFWRRCTACKGPIEINATYYVCSVSSCNRKGNPVRFCSFDCWSAHNEVYRHRNAAAVEEKAPSRPDPEPEQSPRRERAAGTPIATAGAKVKVETDTLVVVSKVKKYIQDKSGLNTSNGVMDALTEVIVRTCDRAIENAIRDNRKTVMDRDVPPT